MKALLVDLDDTLLDYSGGVDDSWCQACDTVASPAGLDPAALSQAIARSRRCFFDSLVSSSGSSTFSTAVRTGIRL